MNEFEEFKRKVESGEELLYIAGYLRKKPNPPAIMRYLHFAE